MVLQLWDLPKHAGRNSLEKGARGLDWGEDPWGEPAVCRLVSLPSMEMCGHGVHPPTG